ncbi:MAG: 16S rRNA (cytosine(1402)-N(4))-methyltransferase RsmH [Alphaproteobacteria bacterium]
MSHPGHIPVLLEATLDALGPRPGQVAVDLTAGRGGHAVALAEAVDPGGRVIGFDLDPESLDFTVRRLEGAGVPFVPIRESFVLAAQRVVEHGLRADVVLADLGVSSHQLDRPQAGFSCTSDGPLDMRYDPKGPVTAADLLASLDEDELARLIAEYGEDPLARKIARKLAQTRRTEPIRSTARLARLVRESYGPRARYSRLHPATRTFMALRIAVNDELGALRCLLEQVVRGAEALQKGSWLAVQARVAVISFHSLEDRLVKRAFADLARRGLATRITKRPLTASEAEVRDNPRSRSAKLRVVRIDGPDGT